MAAAIGDRVREIIRGKSLVRTEQNLLFADLELRGLVLDVGARRAPSYLRFFKRSPGMRYVRADIEYRHVPDLCFDASACWPLADRSVDTVVLSNCLYVFPEPARVIQEAARVLKTGGQLIVAAPLLWHFKPEPHDYYRFTPDGLRWLLERSGLSVELLKGYGSRFTAVLELLAPILSRLFLYRPAALLAAALDGLYRWARPGDRTFCGYVAQGRKG